MKESYSNLNPQVELCDKNELNSLKLNNKYNEVLKLIYPDLIFYIGCTDTIVRIIQQKITNKDKNNIDVALPDTIEYMGKNYTINQLDADVFNDCTSFGHIKLPNAITTIERYSFESTSMAELILPNHLEQIEPWAFKECSLNSLEIPQSVIHIGEHAWSQAEIDEIWFKNEECIANGFEEDTEWSIDDEDDAETWIRDQGYVLEEDSEEDSEHFTDWYDLTTVDQDEYDELVEEYNQQYWTIPSETKIYVGETKKEIENPDA